MKLHATSTVSLPLMPALFGGSRAAAWMLVAAALALLTASAKIQIPLWPVPITMQTYVVLVIAMGYGPRLGLISIGSYIALGAAGMPVFAGTPEKGLGLAYLVGPTGGYLAGFVAAAAVCGWLAQRGWDRNAGRCALAALLGHALILALGVAWLAVAIGWERAFAVGVTPFLWGTALKTVLVAVTVSGGAKWAGMRR